MSSLKSKTLLTARALGFAGMVLSLSSCQELKSETAVSPLRPVDTSRSSVSVPNASNAEVAVAQSATVRLADKRGAGIMGLQPRITLVDGGGSVPAGVSGGTCTTTVAGGTAVCQVSASVAGTYWVKVLEPASFLTTTSVTFVQKLASFEFTAQPVCASCTVGSAFGATVRALDRAGQPIVSGSYSTPAVNVALTNANGATLAGTTTQTAVAGVATFAGLSVNKSGSYTLTVSSGGFSGTSASFSTKAGAPAKILFTTQPGSGAASNQKITPAPVVALFDANDNAITDRNCTITLSRLAGTGTLLGTTAMMSVGGVANFDTKDIKINTAVGGSNYQLRATASGGVCGAMSSPTVDSSTFSITLSGVPYQLAISMPPSTAALSQIFPSQPVVQILDVDGQLCSNDSASVVTITKTGFVPASGGSTGANLVGPSSVKASLGEVRFANLFIDSTAEGDEGDYTYTFQGTAPGITLQPVSATHLVTADGNRPPYSLEFVDQPQPASKNQILPAITVRKIDSRGYLNFTDNTTVVTLTLNGTGAFGGGGTTATATVTKGVATFSGLSVNTTGIKYLTASASGVTGPVNSSNFAIADFGSASQLRFIGSINQSHSTGSNPWVSQPVVYVQDSANNTVSNDYSTVVTIDLVQWSNSAGKPTLMGSISKQVEAGVANFAGLYTSELNVTNLVLQAKADNLLSAQSVTFNGNQAVASSLSFSDQPGGGTKSGVAGRCYVSKSSSGLASISVSILDAGGQVISSDETSTITLSCSGCSLVANDSRQVVHGKATFDNLTTGNDNVAGVVLTASLGGLSRQSNSFTLPSCPNP